jgi:hypothetical protein
MPYILCGEKRRYLFDKEGDIMNLDFHYYATYLAAHYAGFTKEQALVIARSAQLVDDLDLDFLQYYNLCEPNIKPYQQPTTSMPMIELTGYYVQEAEWEAYQMKKFTDVWMGFHFPPGNINGQRVYNGARERKNMNWTMEKDELEKFRLLCLPCSSTVKEYTEDLKKWKGSPFFLQLLGIRMHILADSWAHSGFLGLPLMSANDILMERGIYIEKEGEWCRASLTLKKDNLEKLEFSSTPTAVCPPKKIWTGISYLGHGRAGSIPDYGCLKFKYIPFYNSESDSPELIRDNTQLFAKAFHQMVYAMECVRDGKEFDSEYIPDMYIDKILPVLRTRKLDQSLEWNHLIQQETKSDKMLPDYQVKDWSHIEEYKLHIKATKQHLELFRKLIPEI